MNSPLTTLVSKVRALSSAWTQWLLAACIGFAALQAHSQPQPDYPLSSGDAIRIQVYQNPDLTLETRISESGNITYPLIGEVKLGGLSVTAAERKLAAALSAGGFLQKPQVTLVLTQMRGNQVSVLGQVGRPGRFPLESTSTRLSDILANAGGTTTQGDDIVIVTGLRNGQPLRRLIDLPSIFLRENLQDDIVLQGGDIIYVHRAPVFYIYGEANRPGSFRIERAMTVRQALAQAGGPTARGSQDRLVLHRQQPDGNMRELKPAMTEPVLPNDVIYVRESLF